MKVIYIKELRAKNFKGLIDLVETFDGSTNVYGANESGKSTIYTAFNWNLTGKDEFDRKDYELKNTKRRELNTHAHEVEITLNVDGQDVVLKRAYYEKWVRPTGESAKVFKGHETEFWFNNVKKNATEYQAKVDEIIPAKIIKLITNPYYFNTLNWDVQRSGLLLIAGDITDNEVIDAIATPDKNYSNLINAFNRGEKAEELKSNLAAQKLLLKKAAVEFAPRIDEVKRGMPEVQDWAAIEKSIAEKKGKIEHIDKLLSDSSTALSAKQKKLIQIQRQLHDKQTARGNIRQKIKTEFEAKQSDGSGKISQHNAQINTVTQTINQLKKTAEDNATNRASYQKSIEDKTAIVNTLREAWNIINAEKFEFDDSKCECPTCKQMLPATDIEAKREELRKNFNESVLRRKKSKVDESNQVKAEIAQLQNKVAAIDKLGDPTVGISHEESNLATLVNELRSLKDIESKRVVVDVEAAVDALMLLNADALNLNDEIKVLDESIATETKALNEDVNASAEKDRKKLLEDEIKDLDKKLAHRETITKDIERIGKLNMEEQANAQAIADLEQQEFDLQTYTRARMDILEERVNKMFRYVKFRMFNRLVNGGTEETCVCEYNGVPYPTLNTAAKLLAGLDVLETLSKFYGIRAPVFCDNRESVTIIPATESQIISLFVSPADTVLRTETVPGPKPKRPAKELFEA